MNVYRKNRGNSSLCSHSKHTSVPQTINQKSTVRSFASDLNLLLEMRIKAKSFRLIATLSGLKGV